MSGLGLRERLAERRGKGHSGADAIADLGNGGLAARGPAELPLQAEHHGPTGDDGGDEGGRDPAPLRRLRVPAADVRLVQGRRQALQRARPLHG